MRGERGESEVAGNSGVMGALAKEIEDGETTQMSGWSNPRVQGALALAACIASTQGVPKLASLVSHCPRALLGLLFRRPQNMLGLLALPKGSSLAMVGAAAEAAVPSSIWASEGVHKSASFFTMIFVGFILRFKITNPQFAKGIQSLIMNALLPCVTFKGLVGIKMSRDMIKFPIISGCLSAFYLLFGMVTNRILLPKAAIGSDVPNRTASFINGTMAPGLSAFTYINEFGGPGAAGLGSLMDISVKFYQLVVMDTLMHFCSPKESNIQKKRSGGNPLMAAVKAIFKDNINIAILAGLIMSATGKKIADLGFVGTAINSMAAAQTPVLFALIGLTVKLSGNTPLVSSILLLGRAAASMLFTGTVNMLMGFDSHTAFIVTLFGQSAVSMLGYGILSRVVDNQSKETPAMSKQFAFDLVGYSFPLSIVLNTTACIAKDAYVKRLIPMGGGLLAAVLVVFLATKKKVQDKQTWMTSLAQEREA